MFFCSRQSVSQPETQWSHGAACVAEPGHRDAVAERDLGHPRAELDDDSDTLVTGDERRRGLDRPVAVSGVDVGMAQA